MRRKTSTTAVSGAAAIGLTFLFAAGIARAEAPVPGTEDPNNWPHTIGHKRRGHGTKTRG